MREGRASDCKKHLQKVWMLFVVSNLWLVAESCRSKTCGGNEMKVHGRCHCGQITYSAEVDPEKVSLCHCADCQMLTGSAYRVNVPAAKENFVINGDTLASYIKTADSGNKRRHTFCSNCGTPVYSSAVTAPQSFSLRVGCLDERTQLSPRRQIWCDSAMPWSADLMAIPAIARQ
jgi:hypothetical protein